MTAMKRAALLAALVLCACSPQQPEVAATVNGKPIPVEELRLALAQADLAGSRASAPSELLDRMINRELLAQKAEQLKLDRVPGVAQAIDAARADILTRVYLEHTVGQRPSSTSEVAGFYRENPALFTQRRVYRIFELAVVAPRERITAIRQRVAQEQGLYEIAEWLKAERVAFNAGGVTKSSEHLAPALLQRVSGMKDGQLAVVEVPGGASVIQLVQSESAPLSLEQATPLIEEVLRNRKRVEVADREVKYLRSKAAIHYRIDLGGQPQAAADAGSSRPGT